MWAGHLGSGKLGQILLPLPAFPRTHPGFPRSSLFLALALNHILPPYPQGPLSLPYTPTQPLHRSTDLRSRCSLGPYPGGGGVSCGGARVLYLAFEGHFIPQCYQLGVGHIAEN